MLQFAWAAWWAHALGAASASSPQLGARGAWGLLAEAKETQFPSGREHSNVFRQQYGRIDPTLVPKDLKNNSNMHDQVVQHWAPVTSPQWSALGTAQRLLWPPLQNPAGFSVPRVYIYPKNVSLDPHKAHPNFLIWKCGAPLNQRPGLAWGPMATPEMRSWGSQQFDTCTLEQNPGHSVRCPNFPEQVWTLLESLEREPKHNTGPRLCWGLCMARTWQYLHPAIGSTRCLTPLCYWIEWDLSFVLKHDQERW